MKTQIKNLLVVAAGIIINAFVVSVFQYPNNFLVGGVAGLGRLVTHFTDIPSSVSVGIFTAILFILGWIFLGKKYAATIAMGTVLFPVALGVFENMEFLRVVGENQVLSMLYAGVLTGIGLGLIIGAGGSSGGSDVLAVIFNRKLGMSTGTAQYLIDVFVLLLQIPISGVEGMMYGIAIILIYTQVMNKMLLMGKNAVQFMIISDKFDEINQTLQTQMHRGVTLLHGKTGYLGKEVDVIMCTVSNKQIRKVRNLALSVDPAAFMTILQAHDVTGAGFKQDRIYD